MSSEHRIPGGVIGAIANGTIALVADGLQHRGRRAIHPPKPRDGFAFDSTPGAGAGGPHRVALAELQGGGKRSLEFSSGRKRTARR